MKQNTTIDKENSTSQQSSINQEQVAQRAYELWEAGGQPVGRDLEYWLQAEAELRSANQTSRSQMSSAQESGSKRDTSRPGAGSAGGFQSQKAEKSGNTRFSGATAGSRGSN
jgi:hypothetical protein